MLRLQAPLPDRYTLATPDELDQWIADAKATLGERVLILGHHYQRDEVMEWADARGDSFKLARFAADSAATDIVFCGVHFMAESADVLTGDHGVNIQQTVISGPDACVGDKSTFNNCIVAVPLCYGGTNYPPTLYCVKYAAFLLDVRTIFDPDDLIPRGA